MEKSGIAITAALAREERGELVVPRRCTLTGFTEETAHRQGIHLGRVEPLTRIEIETRNTLYRLTVVEPHQWQVVVRGGRFFPCDTKAYLCGSGYGGSLLRVAWVGLGLCCEFAAEGLRVVTSPVRDFRVLPSLPGPF